MRPPSTPRVHTMSSTRKRRECAAFGARAGASQWCSETKKTRPWFESVWSPRPTPRLWPRVRRRRRCIMPQHVSRSPLLRYAPDAFAGVAPHLVHVCCRRRDQHVHEARGAHRSATQDGCARRVRGARIATRARTSRGAIHAQALCAAAYTRWRGRARRHAASICWRGGVCTAFNALRSSREGAVQSLWHGYEERGRRAVLPKSRTACLPAAPRSLRLVARRGVGARRVCCVVTRPGSARTRHPDMLACIVAGSGGSHEVTRAVQ